MHLVFEYNKSNCPADQSSCNIIEESRHDEYEYKKKERTFPVVGKIIRKYIRNFRFFEYFRKDSETQQQSKKVKDNSPFSLAHFFIEELFTKRQLSEHVFHEMESGIKNKLKYQDNR